MNVLRRTLTNLGATALFLTLASSPALADDADKAACASLDRGDACIRGNGDPGVCLPDESDPNVLTCEDTGTSSSGASGSNASSGATGANGTGASGTGATGASGTGSNSTGTDGSSGTSGGDDGSGGSDDGSVDIGCSASGRTASSSAAGLLLGLAAVSAFARKRRR